MANKNKPMKKKPVQQKVEKKSVVTSTNGKEPSKAELLIAKIGLTVIAVAVVAVIALFVINHFANQEEDVPYEDYIHLTTTELDPIVQENGAGEAYGDIEFFYGKDDYKDLLALLNTNDVVYLYFYRSSEVDENIKTAIENQTAIAGIPTQTLIDDNDDAQFVAFLFIDLDAAANAELFSDGAISHLELDADDAQTLITYDRYQIDGEFFQSETDADDIVEIINGLE